MEVVMQKRMNELIVASVVSLDPLSPRRRFVERL